MYTILFQHQQEYNGIYHAFFPHTFPQVIMATALRHSNCCHYPRFRDGTRALSLGNCSLVRQLGSRNRWQPQAPGWHFRFLLLLLLSPQPLPLSSHRQYNLTRRKWRRDTEETPDTRPITLHHRRIQRLTQSLRGVMDTLRRAVIFLKIGSCKSKF